MTAKEGPGLQAERARGDFRTAVSPAHGPQHRGCVEDWKPRPCLAGLLGEHTATHTCDTRECGAQPEPELQINSQGGLGIRLDASPSGPVLSGTERRAPQHFVKGVPAERMSAGLDSETRALPL